MFAKLAAYHSDDDSGITVGNIVAGTVGGIVGMALFLFCIDVIGISIVLKAYGSIALLLFLLSGFSKYEEDSHRKWTVGASLFFGQLHLVH